MSDVGFGVGVLLALFGPALLIPVVWLCYRVVALPLLRARLREWPFKVPRRTAAVALSIVLVGGVLLASYLPGRIEFERLCHAHGVPDVRSRASADSFFRTRLYPYEAPRYLENGLFSFVEGPHPYEPGVYVRYSMSADGELEQEETTTILSRHAVREELVVHPLGTTMTEKTVYERQGDRVLARAASLIYGGGPLSLFLGVYGMRSCPDVGSPDGSDHFQTFYDLEEIVLGGDR